MAIRPERMNLPASLKIEILFESAIGGQCTRLDLPHQVVETPVFLAVGTAGSVRAVAQNVVENLGAHIILGNTYHLYLRPGHEVIRRMGGLHRFISWPRAMLTDSGEFPRMNENIVRKGLLEDEQFRALVADAEWRFRALVECGRTYGWRTRSIFECNATVSQADIADSLRMLETC
jgi:hypothetical protein